MKLQEKNSYFLSKEIELDKIAEYIKIQNERNKALEKMLEKINKIDLTKEIKSDAKNILD